MKKKISSIILALVLALGVAVALPFGREAKAATTTVTPNMANGTLSVGEKSFTGIVLTAERDSTFDLGTIDLTGINVGTPLISFMPWGKVGTSVADATYAHFEITLSSGAKQISIRSANRSNQELLLGVKHESMTDYLSQDWSNDNIIIVKDNIDNAGAILPFARYGKIAQGRTFKLADGTEKSNSNFEMEAASIYFDNGTLWLDKLVSNNKNDQTKFAADDNLRAEDSDTDVYYRYPILDLTTSNWTPFTDEELKNVSVSFSIDGITAETKMAITELYSDTICVDSLIYKVATQDNCSLTKPAFLTKAPTVSDTDVKYTVYKGTDVTASPFVKETAWSDNAYFTPNEVGTYTVVYTLNVGTIEAPKIIKTSYAVDVVEQLDYAVINVTNGSLGGMTLYVGDTVKIGATVTNPNQKPVQKVICNLCCGGVAIKSSEEIGASEDFTFTTAGEYNLTYETYDLLGHYTSMSQNFYVTRSFVDFVGGITATMLYEKASDVPMPSINDVELTDKFENVVVRPYAGEVKIEYNGVEVDAFVREGAYVITYDLKYYSTEKIGVSYDTRTQRTVYVYDKNVPSIEVTKLPTNVVAKAGVSLADDIIKVKAIAGSEIRFAYGFFASEQDIESVEIVKASIGTPTVVTNDFKKGEYVFNPTDVDTYSISATVTRGVYRAVRTVEIEVKKAWYEVMPKAVYSVTVGDALGGLAPVIKDYYGNTVDASKITVEVYFNYEKIGGEGTVADKIGFYEVKYSFVDSAKGESLSGSYSIKAIDDEKPVITLENKKAKANRGSFVKIADIVVSDKSGETINPDIKVYRDGEEITVYNGGFYATENGTYEVVYTAIDAAGNQQTATYTVTVGATSTGLIIGLSVGGGVLVLLIATIIVLLVLKKKGIVKLAFLDKLFAKKNVEVSEEAEEESVSEDTPENEEK